MSDNLLRPELRSLFGQSGENLSELTPIRGCFCHTLRAEIGVAGQRGADAFEFDVCSPEWLETELESYPIIPGGPRLFMLRFDPDAVEAYVRKRLLHANGEDWATVANKVGRWARWEFEDYTP